MARGTRQQNPPVQIREPGFLKRSTAALSVGTVRLPVAASLNRYEILATLDSDPVPPDVVRNIRSPSIAIRVKLVGKLSGKEISARALLDSGAKGLIIHEDYAKKNNLTLRTLAKPLPAQNVDGSENTNGLIRHTTIQHLRIQDNSGNKHDERAEFYVTNIGDYDVILGTDWLRFHNPEVDWAKDQFALNRCPPSCRTTQTTPVIQSVKTPRTLAIRRMDFPTMEEEPDFAAQGALIFVSTEEKDNPLRDMIFDPAVRMAFMSYRVRIAKTTMATKLAAKDGAPRPITEIIPSQFMRYRKVFDEISAQRLPRHQAWDHAIELKPGAKRKDCGIYRLTPDEIRSLKEFLEEHLKRGTIRHSEAPVASPFFFIQKKGGSLRPVQDYRGLNEVTIKDAYPLPLIPDLIDKLQGARYFTKFDVRWGYNNIRIREGDEHKAAFKTPLGLYEPLVMFFGLCNSPATFQRFMNTILKDLIETGHVVVYMDDILIFHTILEALDKLTHLVLQRLEEYDLYLKPEKCTFRRTKIEYLGLVISEGRISMDPAKIGGITQWPTPERVHDVQAFLGFCNFYRRFIKDYSTIARPLFDLTRKETPFRWENAQEQAFRALINAFVTAPVLMLPDHDRPFRLITDASDFAVGALLEQPDEFNRWHPVAYYSKSMNPAERNYIIHDKELLAIVMALMYFRHYLEGAKHQTEIWTDHSNLQYFMTKQKLTRRQARWALVLSRFDFALTHHPGTHNKSDALSRRPDHKGGVEHDNEERILLDPKFFAIRATRPGAVVSAGDNSLRKRLKETQEHDPEVTQALSTILRNGPRSVTKGLEDWNLEEGLILYKGKIYVPKSAELRRDIVKLHHDSIATGHPGRWKTYELVTQNYWWPGISTFVKEYVDGCATCQSTKKLPKTIVPLQPNPVPTEVWQNITMDFIVDLPVSKGFDSLLVTVDRFSKATILIPCNKTVTADDTAQLFLDNVWRRTGLPKQIISDRGPQFASKVIQEVWKKLNVKSSLSTAYHPQTDGETERVNQELEQYLRIFCNFQADNWAELIPFMEFAHNARSHSATGKSPFEVWYGFKPTFIPPLQFATKIQSVEDRLRALDRLRDEVAAALRGAAETMKASRPDAPTHRFKEGDLVWLEGTNITTTHPKAKLAPKRHRPFKVIAAYPVNCKLELPKSWRIHPVFHNALLKPYTETTAHGPNFTKPPPEIVGDETDHYEVEAVLQSKLTPNKRGIRYLVKWMGYPNSENTWEPADNLTNSAELVQAFHKRYPKMPQKPPIPVKTLQAQ